MLYSTRGKFPKSFPLLMTREKHGSWILAPKSHIWKLNSIFGKTIFWRYLHGFIYLTHFFPMHPLSNPLKTPENLAFFWRFQRIEKGCIGNEWVNEGKTFFCSMIYWLNNLFTNYGCLCQIWIWKYMSHVTLVCSNIFTSRGIKILDC